MMMMTNPPPPLQTGWTWPMTCSASVTWPCGWGPWVTAMPPSSSPCTRTSSGRRFRVSEKKVKSKVAIKKKKTPRFLASWTQRMPCRTLLLLLCILMCVCLCACRRSDYIEVPCSQEDDAHNVQSVIDSLSLDYLQISLSHITGAANTPFHWESRVCVCVLYAASQYTTMLLSYLFLVQSQHEWLLNLLPIV